MGVFEMIRQREIQAIRNEAKVEIQTLVVKNLLLANKYTASEIANVLGVAEGFVIDLKKKLK